MSCRLVASLVTTLALLAPMTPAVAAPVVKLGIEVLQSRQAALLQGKRVGLVTNMSAIDGRGQSDIDLLARMPGVKLTALFAPEHGLRAELDVENIPDGRDPKTGVPIYSLYNKDRAPSAKQLANVDVLVFDIQDAGSRFYTYSTTLGLCMEAAKKHGKRFVVLDRPNPAGRPIEGTTLLSGWESFVGAGPMPMRHG
ncbi:MAG: exo-beta-N-acetylmuramidase NamZ domain-containing protein, partial [Candidatus Sericytochromatia bacterium]